VDGGAGATRGARAGTTRGARAGARAATIALCLAASGAVATLSSAAPDPEIDGPLPIRGQLPFHLLFLDPAPSGASLLPGGRWRLLAHTSYESTLAATDELIRVLRQDTDGTYGGAVTLALLEMVAQDTSGETAFVLDGETLRAVLGASWGAAPGLEIGIEVPLLRHGGGFLDPAIDWYHDRFGFSDGGRAAFDQGLFHAGYVGDGGGFLLTGGSSGLGDIVLSAKAALLRGRGSTPWLSGSVAVKLPTGDPDRLLGSGSTDVGARLHVTRRLGRNTVHGGYGWSRLGGWDLLPDLPLRDPRTMFASWVFVPRPRTAIAVQVLRSSGPFPYRAGSDLGRASMEIAVGFRHRLPGGAVLEYAFLENLNRDHNSPDVGAFLGVRLALEPARQ
jgi:hypothetical protein